MKLSIRARNMSVTPAITKRIEKKTETMGKYLWPETEMQVKMRKEKNELRVVEITVPMGKNVILRSESADENLFLAIDKALAKMERQIRKHRTKLGKNLRKRSRMYRNTLRKIRVRKKEEERSSNKRPSPFVP